MTVKQAVPHLTGPVGQGFGQDTAQAKGLAFLCSMMSRARAGRLEAWGL